MFLKAVWPCPALPCPTLPCRPAGVVEQVTACSCKVGSIRIEVDGSKHDGFYNFLAKGLGDTIRCVGQTRFLDAIEAVRTCRAGRGERVGVET